MPLIIRTEADLLALTRPHSLLHPFRRPAAQIDFPQLAGEENVAWGQRLEYLRQQCGCRASVMGLGAFTAASFVYVLVAALRTNPGGEPDYHAMLFDGALVFGGLILSALIGKFVGLSVAALRFRRACRAILARIASLPT